MTLQTCCKTFCRKLPVDLPRSHLQDVHSLLLGTELRLGKTSVAVDASGLRVRNRLQCAKWINGLLVLSPEEIGEFSGDSFSHHAVSVTGPAVDLDWEP